MITVISIQLST